MDEWIIGGSSDDDSQDENDIGVHEDDATNQVVC